MRRACMVVLAQLVLGTGVWAHPTAARQPSLQREIDALRAAPAAKREERHTVLFLSRVHPKKGVPILVRAWRHVERRFPGWDLVVAGPDERGHLAEVQKLARARELKRGWC